jgi:hypothetical protein
MTSDTSPNATLPAWSELPEKTRGRLVMFFRKVELEVSFEYAAENFPPKFDDNSPLRSVEPEMLRGAYWRAYQDLADDEFWRLYALA